MIDDFLPCSLSMVTASEGFTIGEGFTIADVAFLSGLSRSTVSRMWHDANWMNHVSGKSLQALIASIPGVSDYLLALSHARFGQRSSSVL